MPTNARPTPTTQTRARQSYGMCADVGGLIDAPQWGGLVSGHLFIDNASIPVRRVSWREWEEGSERRARAEAKVYKKATMRFRAAAHVLAGNT